MAKRVIWTATAKKARREILEYWMIRNESNAYSKKLSLLFREKIAQMLNGLAGVTNGLL